MNTQVFDILAQSRCDGCRLYLPGQLAPVVYARVKQLIELLGGKWERSTGSHVFPSDVEPRIRPAIERRAMPDRNPNAYFPTPLAIVERVFTEDCVSGAAEALKMRRAKGEDVAWLEPEGGTGAFVRRMAELVGAENVDTVEIDPLNVAKLKADGYNATEADFLTWTPPIGRRYKGVFMNPPFQGTTYVKHLAKAWGLLESGGVFSAIVPAGFLYASDKTTDDLRYTLFSSDVDIIHLPEGSFTESGTSVSTLLLVGQKDTSHWRSKPHMSFPSWYSWQVTLTIENDQEFMEPIARGEYSRESILKQIEIAKRFFHKQQIFIRLTQDDVAAIIASIQQEHIQLTAHVSNTNMDEPLCSAAPAPLSFVEEQAELSLI